VAVTHDTTCDLGQSGTPSATVAIVREGERTWDFLVLSDTTIVFDCHAGSRSSVTTAWRLSP
jgi:hypothetical protein